MCFLSFLLSSTILSISACQPFFSSSAVAGFPSPDSAGPVRLSMAMLAPGSRILAQYSNGAGEPWHERIILAKAYGSHFAMCSPDLDVYSECIGGTQDVLAYYLVPRDGSRPRGLPAAAALYEFPNFTDFVGAPGAQIIREGIADA